MKEPQISVQARQKNLDRIARVEAAMAAVRMLSTPINQSADHIPAGRTDHPYTVLAGILHDLFDGAYDAGFAAGEDQPE